MSLARTTGLALAVAFVGLLSGPPVLRATTFVMVPDLDLARGASLIVEAEVHSVEATQTSSSHESTGQEQAEASRAPMPGVVEFRVLRHIRPTEAPSASSVEGSQLPLERLRLRYRPGLDPPFAVGSRWLLFLEPTPDGGYRLFHHFLGAFSVLDSAFGPIVHRDLSNNVELALPRVPASSSTRQATSASSGTTPKPPASTATRGARPFEPFWHWIVEARQGRALPPPAPPELDTRFNLWTVDRQPQRWFDFDDGGTVLWHFEGRPGQAVGLASPVALEVFDQALTAWSEVSGTTVRWASGGSLRGGSFSQASGGSFSQASGGSGASGGGLESFDGVNSVIFDDPHGTIGTPFDCEGGGILAVAAPWHDPNLNRAWQGESYHPILGADIVLNKGIQCFLDASPCPEADFGELLAHELGHSLGFLHACSGSGCTSPDLQDALLRAEVHRDCRGPRLGSDDLRGLRRLYETTAATSDPDLLLEVVSAPAQAGPGLWTFRVRSDAQIEIPELVAGDQALPRPLQSCEGGYCAEHLFVEPRVERLVVRARTLGGRPLEAALTIDLQRPSEPFDAGPELAIVVEDRLALKNPNPTPLRVEVVYPGSLPRNITLAANQEVVLEGGLGVLPGHTAGPSPLWIRTVTSAGQATGILASADRFGGIAEEPEFLPQSPFLALRTVRRVLGWYPTEIPTLRLIDLGLGSEVDLTGFDEDGQSLGRKQRLRLNPSEVRLTAFPIGTAVVEVQRRSGSQRAEGLTREGARLPAMPLRPGTGSGMLLVPRHSAGFGIFGERLETRLVLHNPWSTAVEVDLELLVRGPHSSRSAPPPIQRRLKPGQSLFLAELFRDTGAADFGAPGYSLEWRRASSPGDRDSPLKRSNCRNGFASTRGSKCLPIARIGA